MLDVYWRIGDKEHHILHHWTSYEYRLIFSIHNLLCWPHVVTSSRQLGLCLCPGSHLRRVSPWPSAPASGSGSPPPSSSTRPSTPPSVSPAPPHSAPGNLGQSQNQWESWCPANNLCHFNFSEILLKQEMKKYWILQHADIEMICSYIYHKCQPVYINPILWSM